MPTPIENLTQNVNASTQQTVLQAVANDATARQQAADKASAINAIVDNADQQAMLNFFGGIAGDATAEDLLTSNNALIDKVSEDADAIETLNASESAIRKMLCRREGRDPANFADLDAVANDVSLVQNLSLRDEIIDIIRFSEKAHNALSGNDRATREFMCHPAGLDATTFTNVPDVASDNAAMTTITADAQAIRAMVALPLAMQGVAASQTAMQEVINSTTAMQEVATSQTAMEEVAASQTAMDEIANSATARGEVRASATAMSEIRPVDQAIAKLIAGVAGQNPSSYPDMATLAADASAMGAVVASQTALQEVLDSQTAIQAVAASQTAMQEVASSQTALNEIGNNSIVKNTVYDNNTAVSALQNSPQVQNVSDNILISQSITLKNDRVILLSQDPGQEGFRSNQPVFRNNSNSFPHTADRIGRNSFSFNDRGTTTNFSFIDISG